jgi:hypothetical protein
MDGENGQDNPNQQNPEIGGRDPIAIIRDFLSDNLLELLPLPSISERNERVNYTVRALDQQGWTQFEQAMVGILRREGYAYTIEDTWGYIEAELPFGKSAFFLESEEHLPPVYIPDLP